MALTSGQKRHRPMWPEYGFKPVERKLLLLEGDKLYDYRGNLVDIVASYSDLCNSMFSYGACIFSDRFGKQVDIVYEATDDARTKVIANRRGRPILIRTTGQRNESRWLVEVDTWNEVPEPEMLGRQYDYYEHMGVGYVPTPGSGGVKLMRKIWSAYAEPRHTALSLAAESFIKQHSVGGVVHTPGSGNSYHSLVNLDMSSAYLSQYAIHPAGTAIWFLQSPAWNFATYFAHCTVIIHSELALGPFPVKRKRVGLDWSKQIVYPTLKGKYDAYLWKEQVEACQAAGCIVIVHEGYGWTEFTTDNLQWAQEAYRKRQTAGSESLEKKVKTSIVGGIGHHGMYRTHYQLIGESLAGPDDRLYIDEETGEDYGLYIREEIDHNSAFMTHWWSYTVMMTNLAVYKFALPYAREGRLVMVDYDSIMVVENDETKRYVRKYSPESMACPPGTWLWQLLHNVEVVGPRRFKSDELTKLPGGERDTAETTADD